MLHDQQRALTPDTYTRTLAQKINKIIIIHTTAITAQSETGENIVSSLIVNKNFKIQQQQNNNNTTHHTYKYKRI